MNDGTTPTAAPSRFLFTGREIGPPLFFKILRQLGVTLEGFQSFRPGFPRDEIAFEDSSTMSEREKLDADVLIVGAGPAGLLARCISRA